MAKNPILGLLAVTTAAVLGIAARGTAPAVTAEAPRVGDPGRIVDLPGDRGPGELLEFGSLHRERQLERRQNRAQRVREHLERKLSEVGVSALRRDAAIDLVHHLVYIRDMARVVNVHEAKTHFSKLLVRLSQGEEIVIGKAGRPVARLVPFADPAARREPGSARGRFTMKENFDAPLPARLRRFFGS
jgi:prevent-host-death family protein